MYADNDARNVLILLYCCAEAQGKFQMANGGHVTDN